MPEDSNRGRGREDTGLVRVGQLDLLAGLAKAVAPLTRAQEKLVEAGVQISQEPDAIELAYLARQLVQCTLPHGDPGDVPLWTRTNGNVTLVIARTGFDSKAQKPIGYPYGSLPRLLLFWLNTEAVRTGKRRLEMGDTFADFIRALGLDPSRGGTRSDAKRLQEQMRRLFSAAINFQYSKPLKPFSLDSSRIFSIYNRYFSLNCPASEEVVPVHDLSG